jgi:hypothetical protein
MFTTKHILMIEYSGSACIVLFTVAIGHHCSHLILTADCSRCKTADCSRCKTAADCRRCKTADCSCKVNHCRRRQAPLAAAGRRRRQDNKQQTEVLLLLLLRRRRRRRLQNQSRSQSLWRTVRRARWRLTSFFLLLCR